LGYSLDQLNKLVLFESYEKKREATIANRNIYIYIYIKEVINEDQNNNNKKTKLHHVELKGEITNIFFYKRVKEKKIIRIKIKLKS